MPGNLFLYLQMHTVRKLDTHLTMTILEASVYVDPQVVGELRRLSRGIHLPRMVWYGVQRWR